MGNPPGTPRFHDDSDVLVTFDPRARILDVPDDGRVMEMLASPAPGAPARLRRADRFVAEEGWRSLDLARHTRTLGVKVVERPRLGGIKR